jgi:uncharacterized protein (TIGR03086 family)
MDLNTLYSRTVQTWTDHVTPIGADQWDAPTPCTDWTVRDLVNHVAGEGLWAVPLMRGATIAEVGDRFDGDVLGSDPAAAWDDAMASALEAISEPGASKKTVHLSFGDFEGEEYLQQLLLDLVVHGWDLAVGIGADPTIDPTLAEAVLEWFIPNAEAWRKAGALGPAVEVPPGADAATRLIGLSGRQP